MLPRLAHARTCEKVGARDDHEPYAQQQHEDRPRDPHAGEIGERLGRESPRDTAQVLQFLERRGQGPVVAGQMEHPRDGQRADGHPHTDPAHLVARSRDDDEEPGRPEKDRGDHRETPEQQGGDELEGATHRSRSVGVDPESREDRNGQHQQTPCLGRGVRHLNRPPPQCGGRCPPGRRQRAGASTGRLALLGRRPPARAGTRPRAPLRRRPALAGRLPSSSGQSANNCNSS